MTKDKTTIDNITDHVPTMNQIYYRLGRMEMLLEHLIERYEDK